MDPLHQPMGETPAKARIGRNSLHRGRQLPRATRPTAWTTARGTTWPTTRTTTNKAAANRTPAKRTASVKAVRGREGRQQAG
jgi:hypothetical protein